MAYMFGKLTFYVLQPSNLLLILVLAGLLAAAWRRRWGLPLASVAALGIAVCTLLPVGGWLTLPLENRFPAPAATRARSTASSCWVAASTAR